MFEELVDAIRPIRRPCKRPVKLHADTAYEIPRCRRFLRRRGIRIARKGIESSERLGRHRWVVERTLAWLDHYRRLTIRYERRDDIHAAFLSLGCELLCFGSRRAVLLEPLSQQVALVERYAYRSISCSQYVGSVGCSTEVFGWIPTFNSAEEEAAF